VRKSGVVSITTFCSPRDNNTLGRSLLSLGSLESHTAQWQPSVGTPMDVPEPRTVKRIVSPGMFLIVSVLGFVFVVAVFRSK
jgi:hypothetical protein